MRTSFSNINEVAHVYAQRTQKEGRSGNLFFNGDTIYSYGYHFPIGQYHTNKKRETVLLFNSASYSVSTSRHQSTVKRACSQYDILTVSDVTGNHSKNIEAFKSEIDTSAKKALASRKYIEYLINDHKALVETANKYAKFFGLKNVFRSLIKEGKELQKQIEKQKTATIIKAKAKRQKNLAIIQEWIKGEFNGSIDTTSEYLRMKDGETVETSKYATFPLSHAVLALRKVRECKASVTTWRRNGQEIRVGTFHIDSIDERGNVRAGCHKITNTEIERFAVSNNL